MTSLTELPVVASSSFRRKPESRFGGWCWTLLSTQARRGWIPACAGMTESQY